MKDWLKKIETGEIKMRPKVYFIIRDTLVVLAALVIFIISTYLVSLVFFALKESGVSVLPRFGSSGWRILILIFPWIPVLIALGLTFLLSMVLKQYSFAYRKPLLYLPVLIIGVLAAAGFGVGSTPFHSKVAEFSHRHPHPKFFDDIYHDYENIGDDNITVGKVIESSEELIRMKSPDVEYLVNITDSTQFPFGQDFVVDEDIAVIGNRNGNTIDAVAIRRLPEDHEMREHHPPHPDFFLFGR